MGKMIYGSPGIEVGFDDRALLHLQIVITAKLRRGESFVLSWTEPAEIGSGRGAIWLDKSSTLYFRYSGSRVPIINRAWVDVLMLSANSANGLYFTPEPADTGHAQRSRE